MIIVVELERLLKKSNSIIEKLEAEVGEIKAHAVQLSEKCLNLEKIIFTLDNFISNEDIAFYTGFPSYDVSIATYTYLHPGENGENIQFWSSSSSDVAPEFYETDTQPGAGPALGRPRKLNSKEEFSLVMCRLRQGSC